MDTYILIPFVFILGLIIGSFLNVCIFRIPEGKSIAYPPSHCSNCGAQLKAPDLVPVFSYIFLRGHCRYCKSKISVQYPLIELFTAIIFTLLFYKYGISLDFALAAYLVSILIAMFFIDLRYKIIPNGLVIAGLVGGAAAVASELIFTNSLYNNAHWWDHLIGAVSASGVLFCVALAGMLIFKTEDAMGMGDVKIFLPIGMILGWKLCLADLFFSIIAAGLIGAILILFKIKGRKDAIPFGPFIAAATLITLLWGNDILSWYMTFLAL